MCNKMIAKVSVILTLLLLVNWFMFENAIAHPVAADKPNVLSNDLDLAEDDGSVENALMNYLFAKQFISRLHQQVDIRDLQRKRSYWKQCAFNAVSCFG